MLLDEVRVFSTIGPGALPSVNGGIVERDGKLLGLKCLPARLLTADDILLPLGRGLRQANVVEGSAVVTPSGGGKFFTSAPEDTKEAVTETIFMARGDMTKIEDPETIGKEQEEFYLVDSVAADGSSLTLAEPFRDATRSAARCDIIRLLYYTAFADDLSEKELSLGAGNAYVPSTSTIDDALIVDDLWANVAPITATGGLRIYSPLGRGTIQDLLPSWCRGLVRPRRNPILGITGRSGDIYAAAQGALFQADDRWVDEGPTDSIEKSLRFRATTIQDTGIAAPLHDDRVVFDDATVFTLNSSATDAWVTVIDAWVKLDATAEYQTLFWIGDLETDPALDAGSHRVHLIGRLRYGTPELVVGSTATPLTEKGLYITSGSSAIGPGDWAHIRWYLPTRAEGTVWLKPHLKINGHASEVTLNAQDSGVSGLTDIDWIRDSKLVSPGTPGTILVGASRDSYSAPQDEPTFTEGVDQIKPQRIQGFLHSLQGRLGELVVLRDDIWTGSNTGVAPADFDPFALDYLASTLPRQPDFWILGPNAEGVGHKVHDVETDQYGLIRSHPLISLFHEFGRETNVVSWAQFGTQVYATNGSRPAVIIKGQGRLAGVLPPTIKPSFELQRFPVWVANERDKTSAANPANDPIDGATRGAATQISHYQSYGNSYFRQRIGDADADILDWTSGRYFAFKCYWKPASISGRISIWRRGQSKDSGGPFVECRDGKLVFGWYDTALKKEVYVETTSPVFTPGRVHYIYVRKRFPQNDLLEGNWVNSFVDMNAGIIRRRIAITSPFSGTFTVGETITGGTSAATGAVLRFAQATAGENGFIEYEDTAGTFTAGELVTGGTSAATATTLTPVGIINPMHDVAIVKRLRTTAPTAGNVMELDEAVSGRSMVGFTTEVSQIRPLGTDATGLGGMIAGTYSTNATAGRVVSSKDAFSVDHVGMYFQFGAGAFAGKLYRITGRVNTTTIDTVIAGTATAEVFGVASGLIGGIFMGIGLTKSDDFDLARSPDTNGDVEFLGTGLQESSVNGFAPHEGEMWTPGWTTVTGTNGEGAFVFEDVDSSAAGNLLDPAQVGVDILDHPLYDGLNGEPGELRYNGRPAVNEPATPLATFWAADARTFNDEGGNASSQPNGTATRPPFIDKDPTAHPYTRASKAAHPTLKWIQDPSVWSSTRFVSCAFYDPVQDAVSNGGPILTIAAAAEDPKNPSGAVRILLTGLPQKKGHELWVFESLGGSFEIGDDGEFDPEEPVLDEKALAKRRKNHPKAAAREDEERAKATRAAIRAQTRLRISSFGSSAALLRVARFDASANEYAIRATEETIGEGPPLGFDNFPPPACKVLASSGTRLWFGALTKLKQLDGVMYSRAGFPVSIRITPTVGFFRLASGRGDEITGMVQLDELMVIAKDLAVASATIGSDDLARVETVSGGVGAISPGAMVALDDRANFLGDRGAHIVSRSGVTNLGRPVFVSTALENYFANVMDRRKARLFAATINRSRDQYLLLTREVDETRQKHRISMESYVQRAGAELQGNQAGSFRFSRYETPNLSAIGQVQSGPGGSERLVGGTDDGFVVWLDRSDTQGMLIGDTPEVWGDLSLVAGTGSTTTALVVTTGSIDATLEGPRGATVRYLDASSVERTAVVLGAASGILLLDEVADAAVPLDGVVLLGVMEHRFETPWLDLGNPERQKIATYIDFVFRKETTGSLTFEILTDMDDTTVVDGGTIDLSVTHRNYPLRSVLGTWMKCRLYVPFGVTGTEFDLSAIVWRIRDVEQT